MSAKFVNAFAVFFFSMLILGFIFPYFELIFGRDTIEYNPWINPAVQWGASIGLGALRYFFDLRKDKRLLKRQQKAAEQDAAANP